MRGIKFKNFENLLRSYIGKKIARLTILGVIRKNNMTYFECQCECGKEKQIRAYFVVSGATKSCGCLSTEVKRKTAFIMGTSQRKHENKCDYCGRKVRHYAHGLCKNCYNRNRKNGYLDYKPKMSEQERKERARLSAKRYREKNLEKCKEQNRQYYQKNKEKISQYKKQWWLKKKNKEIK